MNPYEFYGKYQKIRDASWRIPLDFGISSFPIRAIDIAKKMNIHVIKNEDVDILSPESYGTSLYLN